MNWLLKFCQNLSKLYRYLFKYQLVWGLGIIFVVAYWYIDRQYIALSDQVPSLSEVIANPIIFIWAIGLVVMVLFLFRLLSIKPFTTPIDNFIVLIPGCFCVYSSIACFFGGYVGFRLSHLILIILGFGSLFLLRWIIYEMKVRYSKKLKSLGVSDASANMFKTDIPIKLASEDELDRNEFSEAIARAMISYTDTNSLTIGLTGEWGSGKSSVVNMCIEYINSYYENKLNKPFIVEFNPWNFSDQNQLIEQFFKILSDAIKRSDTCIGSKYISEKLDAYSTLIGQAISSTALPTPGMEFSKVVKTLGGLITNYQVDTLKEIRLQLDKAIGESSAKIIVIIDDIDRLTNIEIRQVFQLVKSIANFKNTIYFLSFDKKVVINSLSSEQGGGNQIDGEKYLEKIIQVDVDMPSVKLEKVYLKLNDNIKRIFYNSVFDEMRWMNIWYDGFKDFFSNIREVNRYMNALRFQFGLTKDLVNNIDLLVIVAIKVFDYSSYCIIRDNIKLLTGITESSVELQYKKEEDEKIRSIIDEMIVRSKYSKLLVLLKILFPKLEGIYGKTYYAAGSMQEWFTENRICHPERCQVYFQLDIVENDILPLEIDKILETIDNEELFRGSIDKLVNDGKILRFLDIFENYTGIESKVPVSAISNILIVLLDEGDNFPTSNSADLLSTELRLARIAFQLCKRESTQISRGRLILDVADRVDRSLYPLIYVIYLYDQEHGRYGLKENPDPEEWRLFPSQNLDKLEKKGLLKIRKWAEGSLLDEHKNLNMILHIWKTWADVWGDKEEVSRYIKKKIVEDGFFINFIGSFISKGRLQESSNYGYTETVYYDLEEIKKFFNGDLAIIHKRIEKINRGMLTMKQKKILNIFEDALKGKNLSPWNRSN